MLHKVLFSIDLNSFVKLLEQGYTTIDNVPQLSNHIKEEVFKKCRFTGCLPSELSCGIIRMFGKTVNLSCDVQDLSNFIPVKTKSLILESVISSDDIRVIEFNDLLSGNIVFRSKTDLLDGANCLAFTPSIKLENSRLFAVVQGDWDVRRKKIPQKKDDLNSTLKRLRSFDKK